MQTIKQGIEKTGIITDDTELSHVFQQRPLAEYFIAKWLCDNLQTSRPFMSDYLLELGFVVVRSVVDRILAYKYPLHQAVLHSNMLLVAKLLKRTKSVTEKDGGRRNPLDVAVSCRSPQLIRLIVQHGADVSSVGTLLGLSPVEYATRMVD